MLLHSKQGEARICQDFFRFMLCKDKGTLASSVSFVAVLFSSRLFTFRQSDGRKQVSTSWIRMAVVTMCRGKAQTRFPIRQKSTCTQLLLPALSYWRRCGRVRQAEGERLRQLKDLFAKLGVQRPFVCNSQAAAPLASPVGVPKVRVQIDPNAATGSAMTPEVGAIGPAWTRGEIEKPAGTKDMGGWTAGAATSASP